MSGEAEDYKQRLNLGDCVAADADNTPYIVTHKRGANIQLEELQRYDPQADITAPDLYLRDLRDDEYEIHYR